MLTSGARRAPLPPCRTGQAWRKGSALRDIKSLFGVASEGEEPGSRAQDEPNPKLNGAEEQA
jgi:hypothetical protein